MLQKKLSPLAINALRIGNFKVFSNTQYIPIRPLTLIYGVNNSGKSSILHSLLLAHHAIESDGELDVDRVEAGTDFANLGGFGRYVFGGDRSNLVEWGVEIDATRLNTEILHRVRQLAVGVTLGQEIENERVKVRSFFLEADGRRIVEMSIRSDGLLGCDRLELQHPAFKVIIDEIMETTSDSREDVETFVNEQLVPKMVAKATHLFPREINIQEKSESSFDSTIILSRLNEIIGAVVRAIENELGELHYNPERIRQKELALLGFERQKKPPAQLDFERPTKPGGLCYLGPWRSYFPQLKNLLHKNSAVREEINTWLNNYKSIVGYRGHISELDLGTGINKLIPILFYCYGLSNGLVAIEQPEIYLHPKLQAELGDLFIKSALGEQKNTFIIETHSENLLLRIMRRMRQTFYEELPAGVPPVKPEDVSLLFVNPDEDGSIVMEMPLNKKGELKKSWPGGFFEEGLEEVFG